MKKNSAFRLIKISQIPQKFLLLLDIQINAVGFKLNNYCTIYLIMRQHESAKWQVKEKQFSIA